MKNMRILQGLLVLGLFLAPMVMKAQTGTFTVNNTTTATFIGQALAAYDDCSNQAVSALTGLPPGVTVIPNIGPFGTWKGFRCTDFCGIGSVEHPVGCYGFGSTFATFTDCSGVIRTVVYVNEQNAVIF